MDGKHRRSTGDRSSHCMSVDIVGPTPIGEDVGLDVKQKYFVAATVAIPKIPRESDDQEKLQEEEIPEPGEKEGEESSEIMEALGANPPGEEMELPHLEAVEALNERWMEHVKILAEPVGVQNITLAEPLESRNQYDVTRVAEKLYCKFKAHGIQILRMHSEGETAFQTFCRRAGLWQTMRGGRESLKWPQRN